MSGAKFKVRTDTEAQLRARMDRLNIREEEIEEKFVRSSGPGGQKVNKSSTCVYLMHRPSGIEVKCQKTRSQALNRFYARRELCDQLEERILGEASEKRQAIEKLRRQKRKRSKRAKNKMLKDKAHRSQRKQLRSKGNLRSE